MPSEWLPDLRVSDGLARGPRTCASSCLMRFDLGWLEKGRRCPCALAVGSRWLLGSFVEKRGQKHLIIPSPPSSLAPAAAAARTRRMCRFLEKEKRALLSWELSSCIPSYSSEPGLRARAAAPRHHRVGNFHFSKQSNFTVAVMATCRGGTAKRGAALLPPPHACGRRGAACMSLPPPPQQTHASSPKGLNPGVDPGRPKCCPREKQMGNAGGELPLPDPGLTPGQEPGRSLVSQL